MKYFLVSIIAVLLMSVTFFCRLPSVFAQEIVLDTYEGGLSDQWEQKSFKGETRYEVTVEDGQRCIKATSRSSASALYYKIKYDPRKYPLIQWRWKISKVLAKGNALTKQGDDYAPRVYMVFPSTFFWRTKAINYVLANTLPKGKAVTNPFTGNVQLPRTWPYFPTARWLWLMPIMIGFRYFHPKVGFFGSGAGLLP